MTYTRVELEISSDCNAACPGCQRTQNLDIIRPQNITLAQIKEWFPNKNDVHDIMFKFCGVLGDPIVNPECMDITKYLVGLGARVQYSTNGGRNSVEWWRQLGELGIDIHFCVDGTNTNHIYRVNTNYNIIKRNMKAYSDAGGEASWIYIVFDHNEHEVDEARELAKQLGFRFAIRTGMRNSLHDWVSKIGKKNSKTEKTITTTGEKQHSKVEDVKELEQFIASQDKSSHQIQDVINSINCKYIHGREIFVAANSTLWPCCFLWSNALNNKEKINDKYAEFPNDWNNLRVHSISEILASDYYQTLLQDSWDPNHHLHVSRCIKTCAKNRAYHNEFKYTE